jgi:hypothetical protein
MLVVLLFRLNILILSREGLEKKFLKEFRQKHIPLPERQGLPLSPLLLIPLQP